MALASSFLVSIALSFSYYWYLIFIPEMIVGLFCVKSVRGSALVGFAAAVGTAVQLLLFEGTFRLSEVDLVGKIAGVADGSMVFLLLTSLIVFAIATPGVLVGFSLNPLVGKAENET
ncbi:MAG: hypothetical protein QXU18_09020 [Thermoplasmatales archaeon]